MSVDVADESGNGSGQRVNGALFEYTDRFKTSEIFKLRISGMPRHSGYTAIGKFLAKHDVNPVKLKILQAKQVDCRAFATFRSKEQLEAALSVINSLEWKGKKLSASFAPPAADPFVRAHQAAGGSSRVMPQLELAKSEPDLQKRRDIMKKLLRESVESWCDLIYSEQLAKKRSLCEAALKFLISGVTFENIRGSPITTGYRNKVEFTVGYDIDRSPAVGFRVGAYHEGSVIVVGVEPGVCSIVPDAFCEVATAFQEFLAKNSLFTPFDSQTHVGQYTQLTVRGNSVGELLVTVEVCVNANLVEKNTDQEASVLTKVQDERSRLQNFFTSRKDLKILGLLWTEEDLDKDAGAGKDPVQVFGQPYLEECLLGMRFRVNAMSFFQVNRLAAEILYSEIYSLLFSEASPRIILDLCCGTGTIGILMTGLAKKENRSGFKVIGIESCKSAVDDARANANLNDLEPQSYSFINDKIESCIGLALSGVSRQETGSVVAVLDPPRPSVHPSVITCLRRKEAISRIVYAACNPKLAYPNFELLTRPCSRRLVSRPFKLVKAIPIDMFPHTEHYEVVLLFER